MCARVLAELEQLQSELLSSTFQGDPASLRAVADCPFPRAFLDILQTIDAFEGKPLLECVAAGVAIEHRINVGKQESADCNGLGQGHVVFVANKKGEEVERFKLRIERQHSEQEQLRQSEQSAAARHVPNLDAAEKSLREMRAEEGRIRMELAKVHAEAAHQRAVLEKIVQAKGKNPMSSAPRACLLANEQPNKFFGTVAGKSGEGSSSTTDKDCSLSAARSAAWKGPEVNLGMAELLRARGGADRAIDCVSAAGQHLSFVCHVAEFVREARAAMTAQCDEILQEALQQEVAVLHKDRFLL
jgi:hypothetical protein